MQHAAAVEVRQAPGHRRQRCQLRGREGRRLRGAAPDVLLQGGAAEFDAQSGGPLQPPSPKELHQTGMPLGKPQSHAPNAPFKHCQAADRSASTPGPPSRSPGSRGIETSEPPTRPRVLDHVWPGGRRQR